MQIKFENNSVSGIYREYSGFILKVPGHAIGNKAVVVNVPDHLAGDIVKFLAAKHPAVIVTTQAEPVKSTETTVEPTPETTADETAQPMETETIVENLNPKHNSRKGGK